MEEVGEGVAAKDGDVVLARGTPHGWPFRYTVSLTKWTQPSRMSVPTKTGPNGGW